MGLTTLTYIESTQVDPYKNLAVEEYLFRCCGPDEVILYLWQNQKTVVIGRNQNAWKECQISKIQEDGAVVARRLSGGGAVYHDLGNLNFTFLVRKENYNLAKQLDVILRAVRKAGIHAEASGRNDILVDGQKFSGNAFHQHQDRCYHHGTLMVHVKLDELGKYLNVSKKKLESKGIASVRSRVVNLADYQPGLTIDRLKDLLKESAAEVYGLKARAIQETDLDGGEIEALVRKYSSWEWNYGREFEFQYEVSERFSWGQVDIQFQIDSGRIRDVAVYSDALKPEVIGKLPGYLKGVRYNNQEMGGRLAGHHMEEEQEEQILREIEKWLREVPL